MLILQGTFFIHATYESLRSGKYYSFVWPSRCSLEPAPPSLVCRCYLPKLIVTSCPTILSLLFFPQPLAPLIYILSPSSSSSSSLYKIRTPLDRIYSDPHQSVLCLSLNPPSSLPFHPRILSSIPRSGSAWAATTVFDTYHSVA
jgi:hypothetical protein